MHRPPRMTIFKGFSFFGVSILFIISILRLFCCLLRRWLYMLSLVGISCSLIVMIALSVEDVNGVCVVRQKKDCERRLEKLWKAVHTRCVSPFLWARTNLGRQATGHPALFGSVLDSSGCIHVSMLLPLPLSWRARVCTVRSPRCEIPA